MKVNAKQSIYACRYSSQGCAGRWHALHSHLVQYYRGGVLGIIPMLNHLTDFFPVIFSLFYCNKLLYFWAGADLEIGCIVCQEIQN